MLTAYCTVEYMKEVLDVNCLFTMGDQTFLYDIDIGNNNNNAHTYILVIPRLDFFVTINNWLTFSYSAVTSSASPPTS